MTSRELKWVRRESLKLTDKIIEEFHLDGDYGLSGDIIKAVRDIVKEAVEVQKAIEFERYTSDIDEELTRLAEEEVNQRKEVK